MTDRLAAFLTARWDEMALRALAAGEQTSAEWRCYFRQVLCIGESRFAEDPAETNSSEVADHIAASDPAYVLADIASKRKILAEHTWSTEAPHGGQGIARCVACITNRDPYPEFWEGDPWPCATVRLLAEPFAGHPDYEAAITS